MTLVLTEAELMQVRETLADLCHFGGATVSAQANEALHILAQAEQRAKAATA